MICFFLYQEFLEGPEVWLVKFLRQQILPTIMY